VKRGGFLPILAFAVKPFVTGRSALTNRARKVPAAYPLPRRKTAPGSTNTAASATIVAPVGSSQSHEKT
jgi:hypothetical protein